VREHYPAPRDISPANRLLLSKKAMKTFALLAPDAFFFKVKKQLTLISGGLAPKVARVYS
jgi:hypothetical protein